MSTNLSKVVYINKGEHDNPHQLPEQQNLEGSTDKDHSLYLHTSQCPSNINSIDELKYIYHHFQDNEKTHELDLIPLTKTLMTPYTHLLITILNTVYFKMSSKPII